MNLLSSLPRGLPSTLLQCRIFFRLHFGIESRIGHCILSESNINHVDVCDTLCRHAKRIEIMSDGVANNACSFIQMLKEQFPRFCGTCSSY